VIQAANDRKLKHLAHLGRLYGARLWGVLVERQMRAGAVVVVGHVRAQQPAQMTLVEPGKNQGSEEVQHG
jgi:hypothetical protein